MKDGNVSFNDTQHNFIYSCMASEGNVLFNDALNTYFFNGYMVSYIHLKTTLCSNHKKNPEC